MVKDYHEQGKAKGFPLSKSTITQNKETFSNLAGSNSEQCKLGAKNQKEKNKKVSSLNSKASI